MFVTPDDLIKLAVAMVIGCAIGLEREVHNKAAGLRTIILICVGATLITIISLRFGDSRIAANIISGVGFLGAGVIMREEGRVRGLTTASTIWVSAALGLAVGYGEYVLAGVFAATVIVVLWLFTWLDNLIDQAAIEPRTYDVVHVDRDGKFEQLDEQMKHYGVRVLRHRRYKRDGGLHVEWDTRGTLDNHDRLTTALLADPDVRELRY
ncbi:MAG: MgtC/SapB family protein [Chloroflexi bacterium]|nr:MgtC/SapB family protein [Chloroflexota bacterium]